MRSRSTEGTAVAGSERRELLSELFHALNQPLTTLRCALELSLRRPHGEEEYRHTVQAALLQAESITRLTCGIRELLEADDPGDHSEMAALDTVVREAVLDWLPVAEAKQVTLLVETSFPCQVQFEQQRLRQAVFHVLQFALQSAAQRAIVKIDLAPQENVALLRIATLQEDAPPLGDAVSPEPAEPKVDPLQRKLGLNIARSIFEAAGGSLEVTGDKELRLEFRLALASHSADAGRPCGRGVAIQR